MFTNTEGFCCSYRPFSISVFVPFFCLLAGLFEEIRDSYKINVMGGAVEVISKLGSPYKNN